MGVRMQGPRPEALRHRSAAPGGPGPGYTPALPEPPHPLLTDRKRPTGSRRHIHTRPLQQRHTRADVRTGGVWPLLGVARAACVSAAAGHAGRVCVCVCARAHASGGRGDGHRREGVSRWICLGPPGFVILCGGRPSPNAPHTRCPAGVLSPIRERLFPKSTRYFPSTMALAIGMFITPNWTIPRVIGGIVDWYWRQRNRESHAQYCIIVASGLVLGVCLRRRRWDGCRHATTSSAACSSTFSLPFALALALLFSLSPPLFHLRLQTMWHCIDTSSFRCA